MVPQIFFWMFPIEKQNWIKIFGHKELFYLLSNVFLIGLCLSFYVL